MGHGDDEPLDHDGEGDDHLTAPGPPPDPMDRVWWHPTELAAIATASAPAPPPARRAAATIWLVPLLAGAAGALVTIAVLTLNGSLDGSNTASNGAASQTAAPTMTVASAADATARLGASLVAVLARDERGARRGSGICIRHGGQILTTGAVVGTATKVDVTTADGETYTAHVVGRDDLSGIAVLRADDGSLPAADLATVDAPGGTRVWLVGAGTPGSTSWWTSDGIVASTDAIVSGWSGMSMAGLIETDAAAADGARGGALLDDSGAVTGLVLGATGGNMTYAVPIATAVAVAQQIESDGAARHGALGVTAADTVAGPTVDRVDAGSPAANAGIRTGDVIERVGDNLAVHASDVAALVHALHPGTTVTLTVSRGGTNRMLNVTVGSTSR